MIDIDKFKPLNDVYGHLIGDAVLRQTARRVAAGIRPQDLLARYGGDEFAVLLPGADSAHALAIADRLRLAVRSGPTEPEDENLPATSVSVGVATAVTLVSLTELLAGADAALYRAKQNGNDCVSA